MANALTAAELGAIRDEIGTTTPPSDVDLRRSHTDLGHWILVTLRVLRRRRAETVTGGGVSQVSIPGAVSVTLSKTELAALDSQIARLQARYDQETGTGQGAASSTRLTRLTTR